MSSDDCAGPARDRLADHLAHALAALHGVDAAALVARGVPVSDPGHLARLWQTVAPHMERRLPPEEWWRVAEWWVDLLASDVPGYSQRTLAHGDPWRENLLVTGADLTGMIDWEYLSLSDPANDLGVTLDMGEEFFSRLVARYREVSHREDPTLERRARLLGASRTFYGFEFAIRRSDDEEWEDSLESLRAGPILRG